MEPNASEHRGGVEMTENRVQHGASILLGCLLCVGHFSTAHAGACRDLETVAWVLGEWTTSPTRTMISESWSRASDLTFEGESITTSVTDGEVIHYETLRLAVMSDQVFYIAKVPENDLPVPFRLTQCSDGLAVFENPDHDAPQRLVYRRRNAGEMEVRVEGEGMKDFSLIFHRP